MTKLQRLQAAYDAAGEFQKNDYWQSIKRTIDQMNQALNHQTPKRRGRPPKTKIKELTADEILEHLDSQMSSVDLMMKDEFEKYNQKLTDAFLNAPTKPILEEAHEIIYGEREETYGDPGKNLRSIASFWSTYLSKEVTYQDVCNMMVLMKVARLMNTPSHRDSLVDIAGYTALQDRVNRDTP